MRVRALVRAYYARDALAQIKHTLACACVCARLLSWRGSKAFTPVRVRQAFQPMRV